MTGTSILVAELGGTTMRVARYDPASRAVRDRVDRPIPVVDPQESTADHRDRVHAALVALTDAVIGGPPAVAAIAYPGPIDSAGRVLATPTMQRRGGFAPYDLRGDLAGRWPGSRIVVANDLTAAGTRYAADGLRDFAIVTVGSGIGHKVFLDGLPRAGRGRGGEIGHLRVDHSERAPRCDCGGTGHLGAVASGRGTVALYRRELRRTGAPEPDCRVDGYALAAAFHRGDAAAVAAVTTAAGHLGHALAAIHLDTGVEDFLVIGGFARGLGPAYRDLLAVAAAAECWDLGQEWRSMIRVPDAEDDAALLGMGVLALRV